MQVLSLVQGSAEWQSARLQHFTASEAPAMLGLSKYQTRTALLAMKKSGIAQDVDSGTQALFDRGHAAEALARPIAEKIIGEELYPCTGRAEVEGLPLLASFDGLTMDETICWEHKLWNAELAEYIQQTGEIPDTHRPQVAQQILVSGANKCLFMVSDGTEENMVYCWYEAESREDDAAAVLSGWHQFKKDLAEFVPQKTAPQIVAAPVESLPAVAVRVEGSLAVTTNLQKFGSALQSYLEKINRKPETDQDFADAESAIKTLKNAEEALDAAETNALAQVACIDDMRRVKATLHELARSSRLALEKLVKVEKENRRMKLVMDAQQNLQAFIAGQPHADLMPAINADFAGVIKGLKSLDSMADKISTELARVKIEATDAHNRITRNVTAIDAQPEHAALFADRRALVLKDEEFVTMTVKQRIADHQSSEAEKIERIRAEEQAKAEKAAADKIAQDKIDQVAAEIQANPARSVFTPETMDSIIGPSNIPAAAPNISPAEDNGARITLGQINTRLSVVSVTRESLARLGFEPVGKDRAAILYRASDLRAICNAIAQHVLSVPDYVEQEAA